MVSVCLIGWNKWWWRDWMMSMCSLLLISCLACVLLLWSLVCKAMFVRVVKYFGLKRPGPCVCVHSRARFCVCVPTSKANWTQQLWLCGSWTGNWFYELLNRFIFSWDVSVRKDPFAWWGSRFWLRLNWLRKCKSESKPPSSHFQSRVN